MRGRRRGVVVEFAEGQRGELEKLVRSRSVKASLQQRCRAVLAIADGMTFRQAAEVIGMTDKHLRKWPSAPTSKVRHKAGAARPSDPGRT